MTAKLVPQIVTGLIALGGLALAALGATTALGRRRAERRGRSATGVVVDHVYGGGHARAGESIPPPPPAFEIGPARIQPKSREMVYLLVEYEAQDGKHRFRSSEGSRPAAHAIGARVPVYYDAGDPARAGIAGEGRLSEIVMVVFGVVAAAIGAGLFAMLLRA